MFTIFLKTSLPTVFIGHISLAKWNVIALAISVCLCDLMDTVSCCTGSFYGRLARRGTTRVSSRCNTFIAFMPSSVYFVVCVQVAELISGVALRR
jgi:hypothetical protein